MSEKFYRYRALQPSVWSLVFVDFRPTIHPSEETDSRDFLSLSRQEVVPTKSSNTRWNCAHNYFILQAYAKKTEEKRKINNGSIVGENHEVYVRQKYGKKWYAKYVAIRRQ